MIAPDVADGGDLSRITTISSPDADLVALPDAPVASRHIAALDGVRGLAIILVVLHHCAFMLPANNIWEMALGRILQAGWSGVDLFFALSGFLITGILIESKNSINYFSSFYARRILRIFPLYYIVLSIILFLAFISGTSGISKMVPQHSYWKLYYIYVQNWWTDTPGVQRVNIIGHFWSLALEEQFYLVWPAVVFMLTVRRLACLTLVLAIVALGLRIYVCSGAGPAPRAIVENTFLRMDTLLLGAFCACARRIPEILPGVRSALPWIAGFSAFFLMLIGFGLDEFATPGKLMSTAGFSLLSLLFSTLVLAVSMTSSENLWLSHVFSIRILRTFGKYAYGIYVYHVPLLWLTLVGAASLNVSKNTLLHFGFAPLILGMSFFVAKLSFKFFESRFLDLKRYFEPRGSRFPRQSAHTRAQI